MSMMGRFVQVTPERLAQIIDDPSQVTALLEGDESSGAPGGFPSGPIGDMTQLLARAPKLLEASMKTMDPAMREMIKQRLAAAGINTDAMASGKDADALVKLMTERSQALAAKLGTRTPGKTPAPFGKSSPGAKISIDKAWHGVHYLLCGQVEPGATIPSQAVMGGTEIGEDLGYGPARYFVADKVREIAEELSRPDLEAEMIARYDPHEMVRLGIYPDGWKPGDRGWLMEAFHCLRQFYLDASAANLAVIATLD